MIVVIDDEYFFAMQLKKKLKKIYKNEKIKILTSFDFEFLKNNDIEILFLDIELDGENGIEMARLYREQIDRDGELNIVFISSHDDYVYDTFGIKPIDFIRKGRIDSDLEKCIKLINQEKRRKEQTIMIDNKLVKLTDVLYIESRGNNVDYLGANDHIILERRIKLSDVEKELEKYHFIRCHKSYIVNAANITEARTSYVIINNCVKIPISRSEQKHFTDKYLDYYIAKKNT